MYYPLTINRSIPMRKSQLLFAVTGSLCLKVVTLFAAEPGGRQIGWSTIGNSYPIANGNRLFVRNFDYLYCFGDKTQPFAPSAAFTPEK